MRCEAPIPFAPGAGSRLCPFCGAVNLVREQLIATPPTELKIDEVFRQYQNGHLQVALGEAEHLAQSITDNFRLGFYKACIMQDLGRSQDAIYALIDLGGVDAPAHLRADSQAKLAEALLLADRVDESIQAAERCLELQDGHPAGCLAMARALLEKGHLEEALGIAEDTLDRLDRAWRLTFPPQRHVLVLLKAQLCGLLNKHRESAATLEDLLLTDTAAPLQAVLEAVEMLAENFLKHALNNTAAVELLRRAAMLDPENRSGLLNALRSAAERTGVFFQDELDLFRRSRDELLAEIRSVIVQSDPKGVLDPDQITPDLDLTLLDSDPDRRTDLLERAAGRLQLTRFDRGTLYPLRTIEDFRRWVVAWQLRDLVKRLRRDEAEIDRIIDLKRARDQAVERAATTHKRSGPPGSRLKRPWLGVFFLGLCILFVLAFLFLIMAGDRYLDLFEGNLVKVECIGENDGPPCSLHVAAGKAGRKRFRSRQLEESWLGKLWSNWLHGRIKADGTIVYPLDFPWSDLDADVYRRCVGKPIAKMRFTLSPICNP